MSTAALQRIADVLERIEAKMPDERERAELAALTGIIGSPEYKESTYEQCAEAARMAANRLLAQRAESEGTE